jgi:iron complex outermembrane receptor protein
MTKACESGRSLLRRTIAELLRPRVSAPLFATTLVLGAMGPAGADGAPANATVLAQQSVARADSPADDGSFQLDLPSQDLNVALQAVATASHHRLFYKAELVRGKKSAALRGKYTAMQALQSLLSGTELTFEITSAGVVLIRGPGAEEPAAESDVRAGRVPVAGAGWVDTGSHRPFRLAQAAEIAGQTAGQAAGERAQGGDPGVSNDLTEVVVTSQFIEEAAKDVPISMTVIGREELDALRVRRFEDYINHVPNVTYVSGGHFGPDVALRGISTAIGGRFDPISVTVDGAGFGATNTGTILNTQFLDVERIEVLRGPQGTLTGRGAVGGSINIITAQPSTEATRFSGILDVGRFETRFAKLTANVPLGENFAVRAAGYAESSGGAVQNLGPGGGDSGYSNRGGRIAVRWKPADGWTFDAAFGMEKLNLGLETAIARDVFSSEERRDERIAQLEAWGGRYDSVSFFGDTGANGGNVRTDIKPDTRIEDSLGSFRAEYDTGTHRFELFYSHFSYDPSYVFEWDQTEYNLLSLTQSEQVEADSVELRVSSRRDGPVNWVVGASWLEEKNDFHTVLRAGIGADGVNPASDTNFPVVGGAYHPDPVFLGQWVSNIASYGLFGNLFWDINDRTRLSVGGRFSREDNDYGDAYPGSNSIDQNLDGEVEDFSPRVALNLDLNDRVSTYVQYATGFRSGYANNPRAVALGLAPAQVGSEHLKNYEVGIKGDVLDRRLAFAAALFYMDYTDMQTYQFATDDDGNYGYFDINSASAMARGFEVETAFRPTDSLELRANAGYVESAVDSLDVYGELVEDAAFPNVRPWTVAVTGIYTRPLAAGLKGQLRLDMTHGSKTQGGFNSNSDPFWNMPAYEAVDLSVGVSADRWALTAYMKNVLDEKYWTGTVGGSFSSNRGGFGIFVPRSYGLRVTYSVGGP